MKFLGLRGARRGKAFKPTIPDVDASGPADLLDRQFIAARPNQLWVADITYVATWRHFRRYTSLGFRTLRWCYSSRDGSAFRCETGEWLLPAGNSSGLSASMA